MTKIRLNPIGANVTELELGDAYILFSYKTPVAAWISGRGYLRTSAKWSKTTSKHINKWLMGANAQVVPQSEIEALVDCG
jgi:hypothetical protein